MEHKNDERASLNSHGTALPESPQHAAVPATLLPNVLRSLGLGDRPMASGDQAVAALRDEKSHVRVAAIRSLGAQSDLSSLRFLVSALYDPAWEVRAAAVWALSAFGGQAVVALSNASHAACSLCSSARSCFLLMGSVLFSL